MVNERSLEPSPDGTHDFEAGNEPQQALDLEVGDFFGNVKLWQQLAKELALVLCESRREELARRRAVLTRAQGSSLCSSWYSFLTMSMARSK